MQAGKQDTIYQDTNIWLLVIGIASPAIADEAICLVIVTCILFLYTMHKLTTDELIKQKGDLGKIHLNRNEIYLILDNIRSIYNVGAIFRTADAAKIKKLYLCGITAYPPRAEIEKTALKTIEYVPWEYNKSLKRIVKSLRQRDVQIIGLEQTDTSVKYNKFKYKKPVAIIVGNEVTGIDNEVLALCDGTIEIPMHGIANSLNVTTAVGIVLFNILNYEN